MRRNPTYWDYLKLDRLLVLQGGIEGDETRLATDELHFIVVHQVYELWFKLILRELKLARELLLAPRVPEEKIPYVVHHLRRVNEVLKLVVEQFRVMETLIPQDFLDFRDKLTPASGFQSFQMREIEIVLGFDEADRAKDAALDPLEHIREAARSSPGGDYAWLRIQEARRLPTLRFALNEWLYRTPIQGSRPLAPGDAEAVDAFIADYLAALARQAEVQWAHVARAWGAGAERLRERLDGTLAFAREFLEARDVPEAMQQRARRVRAGLLFIESYRELPLLAWPRLLLDTIVEMEEQLVLWRHRHARMVERMIGRRMGTGGSSGVDYLEETARYRVFKELWSVRTLLLPRAALPALRNPELYGFAKEEPKA